MVRKISVSDITMKKAGANAGQILSFREKTELAKLLDRLSLGVIETPPILSGKQDELFIKALAGTVHDSTLAVPLDLNNPDTVRQTWEALRKAAHPRLQVSVPVSTVQMEYLCHKKPDAILALIGDLVSRCAALCPEVEFVAEDSGRAQEEFLRKAFDMAVAAGAGIVTFCDTAGNMLADEFAARVKKVRSWLPEKVRLGVFCSNDMFMADSCAVAAVRSGADEIKTVPYGNSTASLKRFTGILALRQDVCQASCSVRVEQMQRITAQIKRLFETGRSGASAPEEDRSYLNLSAHDSKEEVLKVVEKLGYDLSPEDADKVYETFLRIAAKNEVIEPKELDAIVASAAFQVPQTYVLESFVINSGNTISATCHLRLRYEGQLLESVCVGDGPVDAAFQAIDKVVGRNYELDDFQIRSVTEGREAMGEAVVRLRYEGKLYSGRGISTDIVGSSVRAYLSAVNKIAYEEAEA